MRTIPAAISTGLSSGYRMFYLVKIEGRVSADADTLYYWTTADKNNDGNAITLKETSGGASLTYDSGMIAAFIDQEATDGIGPVEAGVDIEVEGGVASVSNFDLTILNQERFDQTITSTNLKLENRPITVYMGFVPSGASPTVLIQSDMIKIYTGVIESVNTFDFSQHSISCVDSAFMRHKMMPTTVIDSDTYKLAPPESIGQVIPVVYGDFVGSTLSNDVKYETRAPAPGILTDEANLVFHFSDHEMHTFPVGNTFLLTANKFYTFDSSLRVYPVIASTAVTVANTSSGSTGKPTEVPILVNIFWQGKAKGALTDSSVATYENCVDDSATTKVDLDGADLNKQDLTVRAARQPSNVIDESYTFNWNAEFGAIAVGGGGNLLYKEDSGVATTDTAYTDADANNEVQGGGLTAKPSQVVNYQLGVRAATGTAEVENIYMQMNSVKLSGFSEARPVPYRSPRRSLLTASEV